jgi:hypothetical protein
MRTLDCAEPPYFPRLYIRPSNTARVSCEHAVSHECATDSSNKQQIAQSDPAADSPANGIPLPTDEQNFALQSGAQKWEAIVGNFLPLVYSGTTL